jgi:hypothetical protein
MAFRGIAGLRPPRGGDVSPRRRRLGRRASLAATAFAFAVAMLGTTLRVRSTSSTASASASRS